MSVSREGMQVQWEDETKSCQAKVFFQSTDGLTGFNSGGTQRLCVPLATLADTLALFAALHGGSGNAGGGSDGVMTVRFHDNELEILDCEEDLDLGAHTNAPPAGGAGANPPAVSSSVYAHLRTLDASRPPSDWLEHWSGPDSSFFAPVDILREAIEDLEWPGDAKAVSLVLSPEEVTLASHGAGRLSIRLPRHHVTGLRCAGGPSVRHAYPHKQLKAALSRVRPTGGVGGGGGGMGGGGGGDGVHTSVQTKVSVSAEGMLRVMHMVGEVGMHGRSAMAGKTYYGNAGYFETQTNTGVQADQEARQGIVQYLLMPLDRIDDE